jgi:hypothetical protein
MKRKQAFLRLQKAKKALINLILQRGAELVEKLDLKGAVRGRRSGALQYTCSPFPEEQHLILPGIRTQWPAMAENHRLPLAPILVSRLSCCPSS